MLHGQDDILFQVNEKSQPTASSTNTHMPINQPPTETHPFQLIQATNQQSKQANKLNKQANPCRLYLYIGLQNVLCRSAIQWEGEVLSLVTAMSCAVSVLLRLGCLHDVRGIGTAWADRPPAESKQIQQTCKQPHRMIDISITARDEQLRQPQNKEVQSMLVVIFLVMTCAGLTFKFSLFVYPSSKINSTKINKRNPKP